MSPGGISFGINTKLVHSLVRHQGLFNGDLQAPLTMGHSQTKCSKVLFLITVIFAILFAITHIIIFILATVDTGKKKYKTTLYSGRHRMYKHTEERMEVRRVQRYNF